MYHKYVRFINSTFLRTKPYKHVSPFPLIHVCIRNLYQRTTTRLPYTLKPTLIFPSYYSTTLSLAQYEQLAESTLQSLTDQFDSLPAVVECSQLYDVNYADGVLTIVISDEIGTYVINKQTPNRQIWLSSPISGPKRFDLVRGRWIYLHDNSCLHNLLHLEFSDIYKYDIVLEETVM